mmetsp:Transcript_6138/g.10658  ORF Transcript_6138/g.10658 Transcript_6138/m.10658 type:complete len:135 (+) Transcript_6138:113-517(+)
MDTIQSDVDAIVDKIEKKLLRPQQKEAFLCSAKCCDSAGTNVQLQQCMKTCSSKVQRIEQVVSGEMSQFQQNLTRCSQRCQESAQERLYVGGGQPSQKEIEKAQAEMEKCVGQCTDQYRSTIPKMSDRIFSQCK